MAKIVFIGCRLPHGIVLDHPLDPAKKVELAGLNQTKIIGATHATTEVDAEFWEVWKSVNTELPPFKSGAIFEARTAADVNAKAAEMAKETTGFEPMRTDGKDVRAAGVLTADKE